MMEWIKATAETMPPDGETVFVTIRSKKDQNFKIIREDVFWDEKKKSWLWADNWAGDITMFGDDMEVTHWMKKPEPAEG